MKTNNIIVIFIGLMLIFFITTLVYSTRKFQYIINKDEILNSKIDSVKVSSYGDESLYEIYMNSEKISINTEKECLFKKTRIFYHRVNIDGDIINSVLNVERKTDKEFIKKLISRIDKK